MNDIDAKPHLTPSLSHLRAIGFALLGFALWVFSDTSMKLAGESTLPPHEIVAFLGAFGVFFMLLKAKYIKRAGPGDIRAGDPELQEMNFKESVRALWPNNPRKQLGRALLAFMINFFNALAFKHISLTLFYVTIFTAPLVISILASFCLQEKLNRKGVIAIIAGFIGVVIAVDPFSQVQHGDWIGYCSTLAGVVCFAGNTLWLRVMTRSESPDSIAFFACCVEALLGAFIMLFHAEPVSFVLVMTLGVMGFFGIAGNICNYIALKHTTAAVVSQFHYTQIITGAILGYLIWHEIPTWNLVFGATVIIAAGILIATQRHIPHTPLT